MTFILYKKILKEAQDYFDKDEKIYIFKCKKGHKLNPVPSFVVSEQMGFLKFINRKVLSKWIVHTVVVLCYLLI